LESLAQSGFDPLSRATRFMLMEEAFHMFVGETGVGRIIDKTCQVMVEAGITDAYDVDAVRALGAIDLPLLQRKANFHTSVSRDLFGSEVSTNAATYFNAGVKGRFNEAKIDDDHQLESDTYSVIRYQDGAFVDEDVPALNAINARLLDDYIKDCQGGINRWNKIIAKAGIDFEISQPHKAFNRRVGEFSDIHATPEGEVISEADWNAGQDQWLAKPEDLEYLKNLMTAVTEPGEYASWIAPPRIGVDNKEGDFEYVRIQ